jgi:hypothetical protein
MHFIAQLGNDGGTGSILDFVTKGGSLGCMIVIVYLLLTGKLITKREFDRACDENKELKESVLKWQSNVFELMSATRKFADNADRGIGVAEKAVTKGTPDV